jgi:hypothetical protein
MAQDRKGLDLWLHIYMRWCVDTARKFFGLPDDDTSDDIYTFWRYDNDRGWIRVKKDLGYNWGHIVGTLMPILTVAGLLWWLL